MVFRPSLPQNSPREIRRVLRHLRDLIEDTELTQTAIEQRAGLSAGYLRQLLGGRVDLKFRHVLAVLAVLAVPPSRFWSSVFPRASQQLPYLSHGRWPALTTQLGGQQEVVRLYGFGIESVERLRRRLENCESDLIELLDSGLLEEVQRRSE